jgi:uncharacterized protein YdhG (YjbR/CyaY superfamily)
MASKTERNAPHEVDEYIASVPEGHQKCLNYIREIIKQLIPDCKERVSYGIPIFRTNKDLVGISSQKKHCSFHVMSPQIINKIKQDLKGWKVSGSTIHFNEDNLLTPEVITLIVKLREIENNSK